MNLKNEPAYVGRHCGASRYQITPELVDFYADALDHPSRLSQEGIAPSLLFHSECYRFSEEWYLRNLYGNLHARQDWELFSPLQVGRAVRTRSTIAERYTKRGRDYLVNETDVMDDQTGALLVRSRTHQSFLPPPEKNAEEGFVVDSDTAAAKQQRAPAKFPTATGAKLPVLEKHVDERRCWMFSGPERNYHTDREQAKKLGFPTIVVQGMMSTCFVHQVMEEHFGEAWVRGGRMSVKLINVLWVDETVTTHVRIRDEQPEGSHTRVVCDVWIDKEDGARILAGEASAVVG
ncbi:hypothetical protein MK489_10650 [Myxococcota bacterium]|nr:hypothetical protein [Myxococcota bacterium]